MSPVGVPPTPFDVAEGGGGGDHLKIEFRGMVSGLSQVRVAREYENWRDDEEIWNKG